MRNRKQTRMVATPKCPFWQDMLNEVGSDNDLIDQADLEDCIPQYCENCKVDQRDGTIYCKLDAASLPYAPFEDNRY